MAHWQANARKALARAGLSYPVRQEYSQIRVDLPEEGDAAPALRVLSRVYGIARIAPALKTGLSVDEINDGVRQLIATEWNGARTFRVSASRSDKRYPLTSMDLNKQIGALVEAETGAAVDLRGAEIDLRVDVREREAYVYVESVPGAGGLPVGSSGHVAALLSGGIDSPVAAARMFRTRMHGGVCAFPQFSTRRRVVAGQGARPRAFAG